MRHLVVPGRFSVFIILAYLVVVVVAVVVHTVITDQTGPGR